MRQNLCILDIGSMHDKKRCIDLGQSSLDFCRRKPESLFFLLLFLWKNRLRKKLIVQS